MQERNQKNLIVMTTDPKNENETDKTLRIILDEAISSGSLFLSKEILGDGLGSAVFLLGSLPSVFSKSDTPHADAILSAPPKVQPASPAQKSR